MKIVKNLYTSRSPQNVCQNVEQIKKEGKPRRLHSWGVREGNLRTRTLPQVPASACEKAVGQIFGDFDEITRMFGDSECCKSRQRQVANINTWKMKQTKK